MAVRHERCRVCDRLQYDQWGTRDGLDLLQCTYCQLVFFHPYPIQADITKIYSTGYHSERGYGGGTELGRLRKKMYELDIKDLEQQITTRGKFLDVGCAEGAFLSQLSNQWVKYGVDISSTAIEKAAQHPNFNLLVGTLADVPNDSFDVIHLRGVLEHILDPYELTVLANQKLKNGGYLVFSNTPNTGGIVPRLFRGRYRLVLPNEHVNYFSPKAISILADRGGFRLISVKFPYFGSPYESFLYDLLMIPVNFIMGRLSPPFYGNILTAYLKKQKSV